MRDVTKITKKGLLEEIGFYVQQLTHTVRLLNRIKDAYPHVFNECVSKEDVMAIRTDYKEEQ